MKKMFSEASQHRNAFRALAITLGAVFMIYTGFVQAADSIKGTKLYNERCANCHGSGGKPNMPGVPDFSRNQGLMQGDLTLVKTISVGKGMMPAFQGLLTQQEIFDVVAYLRTLQ